MAGAICQCCGGKCTNCAPGDKLPKFLQVDNIGSYTCNSGGGNWSASGSYILEYISDCEWRYTELKGAVCNTRQATLVLRVLIQPTNTLFQIQLNPLSSSPQCTNLQRRFDYLSNDPPPDCQANLEAGITLNFSSSSGFACAGLPPASVFVHAL